MTYNAEQDKDTQSYNIGEQSTPLMRQYAEIKQQYIDALILFQVGDFYEMFYEDAKLAASCLGIALTARGKNKGEPIPLCGVPVHALHHYLPKLITAGFKVVLCEQLEQPRGGMLVRRGITRVYTPGTLTDTALLKPKHASYVLAISNVGNECALLFSEILTARLFATIIPSNDPKLLESELIRFTPDEILVPVIDDDAKELVSQLSKCGFAATQVPKHDYAGIESDHQEWKSKRDISSQSQAFARALQCFYAYMWRHQKDVLSQFTTIEWYNPTQFLYLDATSQRNLELVASSSGTGATLFDTLDHALTGMGSRMLKRWIMQPLQDIDAINQRLDVIEFLLKESYYLRSIEKALREIGDLERAVGRIALRRAPLHDYHALLHGLSVCSQLYSLLTQVPLLLMQIIASHMKGFDEVITMLTCMLPETEGEQGFKKGFDERLDTLRQALVALHQLTNEIEQREITKTGITSLKVRYNNIQGFYIEITKTNQHLVPTEYQRAQTLVGRERYVTAELQQLNGQLQAYEQAIAQREQEVFASLINQLVPFHGSLHRLVYALAQLDALTSLTIAASNNNYVRPQYTHDYSLTIIGGRHPVVEKLTQSSFIPNDLQCTDHERTLVITGPNMGGKSTYLRQNALIVVMGHMGSFVPASHVSIPIIDRIFTRVGASDQLAKGKSTFLVEMEETATICLDATDKSLVILDEVGRGTSTFDGLSLAQAIVEYIHTQLRSYCLFATHYHELTTLAQIMPGIRNFHAASKRMQDYVVLLHKILPGVAEGSYGLEVARVAQIPKPILTRAQELLKYFAEQNGGLRELHTFSESANEKHLHATLIKQLQDLDINELSPRAAHQLLSNLIESLKQ